LISELGAIQSIGGQLAETILGRGEYIGIRSVDLYFNLLATGRIVAARHERNVVYIERIAAKAVDAKQLGSTPNSSWCLRVFLVHALIVTHPDPISSGRNFRYLLFRAISEMWKSVAANP
jgi:hypothetical protein